MYNSSENLIEVSPLVTIIYNFGGFEITYEVFWFTVFMTLWKFKIHFVLLIK